MRVLGAVLLCLGLSPAAVIEAPLQVKGSFEASYALWTLRGPGYAFDTATNGGSSGFWRTCRLGEACDVNGALPALQANLFIEGAWIRVLDGELLWTTPAITFPVRDLPASGRLNFDRPIEAPISVSGYVKAIADEATVFTQFFEGSGTMMLNGFFVSSGQAIFDATGDFVATLTDEPESIPEPATWLLLTIGIGALSASRLKKRGQIEI